MRPLPRLHCASAASSSGSSASSGSGVARAAWAAAALAAAFSGVGGGLDGVGRGCGGTCNLLAALAKADFRLEKALLPWRRPTCSAAVQPSAAESGSSALRCCWLSPGWQMSSLANSISVSSIHTIDKPATSLPDFSILPPTITPGQLPSVQPTTMSVASASMELGTMKASKATVRPTRMPFFCPCSEAICTTLSMIPLSASKSKRLVEIAVGRGAWWSWSYRPGGAIEDCTRMLANSLENGISARVMSQPAPANSPRAEVACTAASTTRLGGMA
mmetsp:Transcript_4507/g.11568  ORF Transcript_4507/g.11568 Transcript_4507/m.11568 type:complete len:275 (+) Transcript_4507:141-965(+)